MLLDDLLDKILADFPDVFGYCDRCGEAILVGDRFTYVTVTEEIAVSTEEMVTHERGTMNFMCGSCASRLDLSRVFFTRAARV
ncbi:MAG: hypothetical protein EPO20_15105 [Betaproteobacteria bacterium]|nr:MAG: hypothetical protein EPO20_15105 [Betaproteobacteria bacterium]